MRPSSSASPWGADPDARAYRPIRTLGKDGDVQLAHDLALDRAVVLRFISPDAAAARLLLDGARALARVSHRSLARVYRIQESGRRPCVVQSFERGERLDELIEAQDGAPFPRREVLGLGRALAAALLVMHPARVAHGGVRADGIVVTKDGVPRLIGLRRARAAASAEACARDVADLVALLRRMAEPSLDRSLAELASVPLPADELLGRLEELAHPEVRDDRTAQWATGPPPDPYPGLRAFDVANAAHFHGRQLEIDEALERLRGEPWLLVTGPSGSGKSSLVRAGVVPAIAAGALGERARWEVVTVIPGQRPLGALAAALAPLGTRDPVTLEADLRADPGLAGRIAREMTDAGVLLVVDQLEEAISLVDAADRDLFFAAFASFGALVPGVRAIATIRGDFLGQLGSRGGSGRDLLRAAFVLPPMTSDGIRQAIVGPARARGYEMETSTMVENLATEAAAGAHGLPLLAFLLAELWHGRDDRRRLLPEEALARLGGAAVALARHSDTVLAALDPGERTEARRMLVALVTASGTGTRCMRETLVGERGQAADAALEGLVRGRLVVAGETYALAHEALVEAWPRLRGWLDQASDARATAIRLASAASEWVRLGRRQESLWSNRQLVDLETPGALDGARRYEGEFVDASRAAARMDRVRWWARTVGAPAAALLLVVAVVAGIRWKERRGSVAFVAARLAEAAPMISKVTELDAEVAVARAEAFTRYDADDTPSGELRWRDALSLAGRESEAFAAASAPLASALALAPSDASARAQMADLLSRWFLEAERDRQPEVARDVIARLARLDDDGSRRARLSAPARLSASTVVPGARVVIQSVHLDARGYSVEGESRPIELGRPLELAPGSYLLAASAPDRYPTRYPVALGRGEDARVEIPLPLAAAVPTGFVFVPAGLSLVGTDDVEDVRMPLSAEPEHPASVNAFLIGEYELTYAEYLEFLASLSPEGRAARRPLHLDYDPLGVARLTIDKTTTPRGDAMCRVRQGVRVCRDWLRFPVGGIGWDDAVAYVAWLAERHVPGAHLCTKREWERAARGADGRRYPYGNVSHPGDANDGSETAEGKGPDEVGSFPRDRSPFGVYDLGGNVGEWVTSKERRETRGGDWFFNNDGINSRAAIPTLRNGDRWWTNGARVCAAWPTSP